MQAVIMAAGKGVRMLPLTQDTPKSLLKVGEKTILDRTLDELPEQVDEIILIVGYLSEQIKGHVKKNYPDKKFVFVECEPLGTGYAVQKSKPHLKSDFIVLNGDDLYKRSDIEKLLAHDLAILTKDLSREPGFPAGYERFGRIVTDKQGNFSSFELSTDKKENLGVIGAYKLNQDFFNYELVRIKNGEFGLPQTIFSMSPEHKIKVIKADYWVPIGFPEDLKKAEKLIGGGN